MSDDVPNLDSVVAGRRHEPAAMQNLLKRRSNERLSTTIGTKIKTSFIGAISRFEKYFGHLWGHGKKEKDLTSEERLFRDLWNKCRIDVLTNGNNQARAMTAEVKQYDVLWNRHKMTFKPEQSK